MKLSIIIPIYNVETTLKRCLDSIISQDMTTCEIILINDGSTDNSGNIGEQLFNFLTISKDNSQVILTKPADTSINFIVLIK